MPELPLLEVVALAAKAGHRLPGVLQALTSDHGRMPGMPVGAMRIDDYRAKAVAGARRVAAELERRGVKVLVTGSLARGRFELNSDVDFVVLECPRNLKYAIEGIVEDELRGIPFDVVYREEIPPSRLERFREGAVSASDLSGPCGNPGI